MGLISSIEPQALQCDLPGLYTLKVHGSGFIGTDSVNWDGVNVATVVVSPTLMTATINPSGAAGPKYVPVKVTGDPAVRRFHWTPGPIHGVKSWYDTTP